MITNDLIGSVAGTLTTVSFLPQVLKTYRSRSAKDISLVMFLLFSLGVFLWLLYGLSIQSMPIIISNFITLVLSLSILVMKFWFGRKTKGS
jgi:MtN3 and saliva related transmembrane protein